MQVVERGLTVIYTVEMLCRSWRKFCFKAGMSAYIVVDVGFVAVGHGGML